MSMAFLILLNSETMLDFRKNEWMNELRIIQAPMARFPPWHLLVMYFISMAKNQKRDIPSIFVFFATIPLHMCMGIKVIWKNDSVYRHHFKIVQDSEEDWASFRWDCTCLLFAQQPAQWGWDFSQALLAFYCLFHINFCLAPLLHRTETPWPLVSLISHMRWHKKPLEALIIEKTCFNNWILKVETTVGTAQGNSWEKESRAREKEFLDKFSHLTYICM